MTERGPGDGRDGNGSDVGDDVEIGAARDGVPTDGDGSSVPRDGAPSDRDGAPSDRDGGSTDRDGGSTDRDGGSTDRDGSPADVDDPEVPAQAIQTEALTKHYGETIAVEDLDLWIPRGSVYGFLGPNGAGKTTTMRMLTTLTAPTSGRARVAGHDVADREAVVEHVGYLPEEPPLHDELTGREQLEYVAGLRDLPDGAAAERIDELLDRFGLSGDADRRIGAYSTGMKQKTGIIQAILHEPAVVFLDEPTSGLDPRAARTVRETIADLSEEAATTVFLSTHILSVVDELADTVGVLFDGRLVTEGSPETLKRRVEAGTEGTLEDVFIEVTGGPDAVDAAREDGETARSSDTAVDSPASPDGPE